MFEAFEYNHLTGVRRSWWARFIMWARNFCPTHHVPMWLYERGFGGVWVCDECDKERKMEDELRKRDLMDEAKHETQYDKFRTCFICTLAATPNQDTVTYRNRTAHRQCMLNIESGAVPDPDKPVPITLDNLADGHLRLAMRIGDLERNLDQLTGVHNAVSGEVAQHKKQMHDWHMEVYQFVLTVSNRLEQLEQKYHLAFEQTTGTGYMMDAYKAESPDLISRTVAGLEYADAQQNAIIQQLHNDVERWRTKYLNLWKKFIEIERITRAERKSKDAH